MNLSERSPKERREYLKKLLDLTDEDVEVLSLAGGLSIEMADGMIENVVGLMSIPVGVAQGFLINGRKYVVPMATEEKKVVKMALKGAELTRPSGGFKATSTDPIEIGQIQLTDVSDKASAMEKLRVRSKEILDLANKVSKNRKAVGLRTKPIETSVGSMLVVELLVDVKDSFGANVVDTMCEVTAPLIEAESGGKASVRVISNLSTERKTRVQTVVNTDIIDEDTANGIVIASNFAAADPYRSATQNKGIMNGVSAVLMATSNDTRAVEAGAHAYAAITGMYKPLSRWWMDEKGDLQGEMEMPMSLGIIGGTISVHPTARVALKMMRVKTANELGCVAASVGLACNLGALHALVIEGISKF